MADLDIVRDSLDRIEVRLGTMELRQLANSETLAVMRGHVEGQAGEPGLRQRLREVEETLIRHDGHMVHLMADVPEVKADLGELLTTENREHGALRLVLVGVPLVGGFATLVVTLLKAAGVLS